MSQRRDTEQHFIECSTCNNYSHFYCNICHQRVCEQCRAIHLREKNNGKHEIVPFQDRCIELPIEKCLIHLTKVLELYCVDCSIPICSKCFTTDHNGHQVLDLEVVYNKSLQHSKKRLINIRDNILPECVKKVQLQREKVENFKIKISSLRMSMKHSVDEIKTAVDTMLADSNAELDRIESSIIDEISKEEKKTEEHITWLNKLMEDYISNISSCKPSEVITFNEDDEENILVQIPDIIDPVVPEFKKGRIIKEEIKKLFGSISFCTLSERKMPKENDKINLKSLTSVTSKPTQQQSMKIPFSLKKLQGVDLSFRNRVRHLSPLSSGKFWASDSYGHLFQFDLKGNIFKKLNIGGQDRGFHTVTKDDDLLYTDYNMKAIYKMNSDLTLNDLFITTGDWEPWSVYCSLKSGDILVGMTKDSKWKITRYSNEGVKLHDIRRHDNGKELYSSIGNITENINGDVCTIDYVACKLVVVTRSGDYRFHYAGFISHSSLPSGICTDILGNILVGTFQRGFRSVTKFLFHATRHFINGDGPETGIYLLDRDGRFLSILKDQGIYQNDILALCFFDHCNLIVGGYDGPVTVYKYLYSEDTS